MILTLHDKSISSDDNNLVTVQEVQSYIKNYDVSLTAFLDFTISSVSDAFDCYCKRSLKANDWEGIYSFNFNFNSDVYYQYFYPDNYPVNSISAMSYRYTPIENWITYDVTKLEYHLNKIMFVQPYFVAFNLFNFKNVRNLKIQYNAGYSTIPYDLRQAAIEQVAMIYKESANKDNRLGIRSTNVNEGNNYGETFYDISPRIKEVLDSYKKTIL